MCSVCFRFVVWILAADGGVLHLGLVGCFVICLLFGFAGSLALFWGDATVGGLLDYGASVVVVCVFWLLGLIWYRCSLFWFRLLFWVLDVLCFTVWLFGLFSDLFDAL